MKGNAAKQRRKVIKMENRYMPQITENVKKLTEKYEDLRRDLRYDPEYIIHNIEEDLVRAMSKEEVDAHNPDRLNSVIDNLICNMTEMKKILLTIRDEMTPSIQKAYEERRCQLNDVEYVHYVCISEYNSSQYCVQMRKAIKGDYDAYIRAEEYGKFPGETTRHSHRFDYTVPVGDDEVEQLADIISNHFWKYDFILVSKNVRRRKTLQRQLSKVFDHVEIG